jgi:protein N-terminal methyltransferase
VLSINGLDGVLGGYGKLTPMDVRDSNQFLDRLKSLLPGLQFNVVADCGAGIGRVSKFLLLPRFQEIHLIEQSARLLAAAPQYVSLPSEEQDRLVLVQKGLQDFSPAHGSFDVIWIQWVIGHLHDHDFIRFFRRCAGGLRNNGVIVLKDNTIVDPELAFCLDLQDHSVARHLEYQKLLFEYAGLEIVAEQLQKDFPEELYPVYMIALRPKPAQSK